ncbi:MAG: hypothetical protein U0457_11985 [Candidatus Sericytochromatia bacterium]
MKKILLALFIVFFMLFIFSCKSTIDLEYEKKDILYNNTPLNIYIDTNDNGIIVYPKNIYKIKNLNITNEKLELNDPEKDFDIINTIYSINEYGNGILIYSRSKYKEKFVIDRKPKVNNNFYLVNIENNKFYLEETKKIFEDNVGANSTIKLFNQDSNNFIIYYRNIYDNNLSYSSSSDIKIKKILKDMAIDLLIEKNSPEELISLNIDKEGLGWLFYFNLRDYLYKINKTDNFIKKEPILINTNNNYNSIDKFIPYLDKNGNGFIFIIKYERINTNIYLQRINNFTLASDVNLIFSSNDLVINANFMVNENGNGVLFFYKNKDINNNFKYPYIKKINNFIVENKEIKLIDSNKYKYHDYYINKNGNGIIILTDEENFIFKKIRNYEIEN